MQGIARAAKAAKAAKAANETLYSWYGDKKGLMATLIARSTDLVRAALTGLAPAQPLDRLSLIGPALLAMVLGPRAVALNRAAAADPSGGLGRSLSQGGRETVAPLIASLMDDSPLKGDPALLTQLYLTLLIGDLQIRRVTGAMPPPDQALCNTRAAEALAHLRRLAT